MKKRTPSKKQSKKSGQKKANPSGQFKRIVIAVIILIAICFALAVTANLLFKPDKSVHPVEKKISQKPAPPSTTQAVKEKAKKTYEQQINRKSKGAKKQQSPDQYETFKDIENRLNAKPILSSKDNIPKIAIIIDDIGYDTQLVNKLLQLDANITFAVLPFSPFGKEISEKLYSKGAQIMLHLPMEPVSYPKNDPGAGALLSSMSPDALLEQLKTDLNAIPHISGVNNHMGSKLCTYSDRMNQIFSILKRKDLFYVDSRTALETKGLSSARLLRLKFAQRDVFLDNNQNIDYISGKIKELVSIARKDGYAIGIGHPYNSTVQALVKELPKLKNGLKNKINFVRVSELTVIYN